MNAIFSILINKPRHTIRNCSQNSLHHGQVLAIVMRLEERDAQIELEHDAADGPNVTRLRPAKFQDDFRGSIMSRRDDRAVMFVIKGGASEVDEPSFGVFDAANLSVLEREHFQLKSCLCFIESALTFRVLKDVE